MQGGCWAIAGMTGIKSAMTAKVLLHFSNSPQLSRHVHVFTWSHLRTENRSHCKCSETKAPPASLTAVRGQARESFPFSRLSPKARGEMERRDGATSLGPCGPARLARRAALSAESARLSALHRGGVVAPGRATGDALGCGTVHRVPIVIPSLRTDHKPVLVPVGGSPRLPGAFVSSTKARRRRSPRSAARTTPEVRRP